MRIKRTVNIQAMKNLLQTLKKTSVKVGWQGDLAKTAFIQEYGAQLKGGQPYMVDNKGYLTFLRKDSALGQKAMRAQSSGAGRVKVAQRNKPRKSGKIAGLGVTKPSRIPARFLMLHTKENHSGAWKDFSAEMGRRMATGRTDPLSAMQALGARVRADIQEEIAAGQPPRNTALTAMRKGFNHPLESQKNQLFREIRVITEGGK